MKFMHENKQANLRYRALCRFCILVVSNKIQRFYFMTSPILFIVFFLFLYYSFIWSKILWNLVKQCDSTFPDVHLFHECCPPRWGIPGDSRSADCLRKPRRTSPAKILCSLSIRSTNVKLEMRFLEKKRKKVANFVSSLLRRISL